MHHPHSMMHLMKLHTTRKLTCHYGISSSALKCELRCQLVRECLLSYASHSYLQLCTDDHLGKTTALDAAGGLRPWRRSHRTLGPDQISTPMCMTCHLNWVVCPLCPSCTACRAICCSRAPTSSTTHVTAMPVLHLICSETSFPCTTTLIVCPLKGLPCMS